MSYVPFERHDSSMNVYSPKSHSVEREKTAENNEYISKFEKLKDVSLKKASYFREYPDLFIDEISTPETKIKLFFYQRLFLRAAMRHRYVFATFTRAFSKSFLSILTLFLKCVFYPGVKVFVCSGGKEQAANIAKEKLEEIFDIWPVLRNEVKDYQESKDYVKIVFQNNSKLDIVAVENSSRGGRRNGGLIEEAILVDGQKLSEVIIPLMNVDRRVNGEVDPNEVHKHQIFVTTAGYKNTFAYNKMIQLLVWMAIKEDSAFVFGGSWRIPVMHKLLDENFVEELKEDGTYNELSFAREYESIWSGSSEASFFNADIIDRHRVLENAEFEPDTKSKAFYVISADVARVAGQQNADTVAIVIKVIPRKNGTFLKRIVNIYVFNGEHFEKQSIRLKKLVFHYNAKQLVVDANGLGVGLVDFLIKENVDDRSGEIFPPFSVTNDSDYDKYKTKDSLPLLFNVKANASNSSQIHVNCLSQISSGRVKFLIDEMAAKAKLSSTPKGRDLLNNNPDEFAKLLAPYVTTSIMKEEMLNLQQKQEGKNLKLERINKRIGKDKFSALEYGLWYLKTLEDKSIRKKESSDADSMFLFKEPKYKVRR